MRPTSARRTLETPRDLVMSFGRRILRTLLLAIALSGAFASVAAADAVVVVHVRDPQAHPAEGRITLTPKGGGASHSCTTHAGTCRIAGVPGGQYQATLVPTHGTAPPARTVMIPPSGTVTLIVSSRR